MMGSSAKNDVLAATTVTAATSSNGCNNIDGSFLKYRNSSILIDKFQSKDFQYPDLYDVLMKSSSSRDYCIGKFSHLIKRKSTLLPEALYSQFDTLECKCFMGLFPEIDRAWLTIDNKLFLWSYNDCTEFTLYDKLDQVIVSVALVKPKPGIFVKSIEHILVLTTPLEIVILAIYFDDTFSRHGQEHGDLILKETGMITPTDGINILSITGTDEGRIFMCGSNGHLYELLYQQKEGFFSRKCQKANKTSSKLSFLLPTIFQWFTGEPIISSTVDNGRNLLFTLSESSKISVYDISKDFIKIAESGDIYDATVRLCPRGSLLSRQAFSIISIHKIEATESLYLNLIGVTSTGIRLFFSCLTKDLRSLDSARLRALKPVTYSCIELVHVRLPPIDPSFDSSLKANPYDGDVHAAFYSKGVFLVVNSVSEQQDKIIQCSVDQECMINPMKGCPLESFSVSMMDGKVWTLAECCSKGDEELKIEDYSSLNDLNELAFQNSCKPRYFLSLMTSGVSFYVKIRPFENLQLILEESSGNDSESLIEFFENFGKDESCAMCLQLICSETQNKSSIPNWASYAFFKHGGEPKYPDKNSFSNTMPSYNFGKALTTPEISYSGIHNGICIYLSRILLSIWKKPILSFKETHFSTLSFIQHQIRSLIGFFNKNPRLTNLDLSYQPSTAALNITPERQQEAYLAEVQSLRDVYALTIRSLEAISFLMIISDYNISNLVKKSPLLLEESCKVDFSAFVASFKGIELAKDLVDAIVTNILSISGSCEAICEVLAQRCPSYFGQMDIVFYKAIEALRKAKESHNSNEKTEYLNESLKAFMNIAQYVTPVRLSEIKINYEELSFYTGIIELSLACAVSCDASNYAISYYKENFPQGREFYLQRIQYYEFAFEAILKSKENKALSIAFKSTDELFHYLLYEWLLQNQLEENLLQAISPFTEAYLIELGKKSIEKKKRDLLWKYYSLHKQYIKASKTLYSFAENRTLELSLTDRIEYLSLSISNYKSVANYSSLIDFTKATEALEVATLQYQIQKALEVKVCLQEANDISNNGLWSLSDLYHQYIKPFNLNELALDVIKVANYTEVHIIQLHWNAIIEEELQSSNNLDSLSNRIVEIGSKYSSSEQRWLIPLDFLASRCLKIEHDNINSKLANYSWTLNILKALKYSYQSIYEEFNRYYISKLPPWDISVNAIHLLNDIVIVLETWYQSITSQKEKEMFPKKKIHDSISDYVLFLVGMSESSSLLAQFKRFQQLLK